MKSRELHTIHNLIATNYKITQTSPGEYVHTFTPATTNTIYYLKASSAPIIKEGEHYNIGFSIDSTGRNIVDPSAIAPISQVNPVLSLLAARQISNNIFETEKAKNDIRVKHSATDGYYWGKKYAWRVFGLVIPKNAFYNYLKEISHPCVSCITSDPDLSFQNEPSIAYKEDGLENAVNNLIVNATKHSKAYFTSPNYSKKFSIREINAITDKK